jgi:hypothetical protein
MGQGFHIWLDRYHVNAYMVFFYGLRFLNSMVDRKKVIKKFKKEVVEL